MWVREWETSAKRWSGIYACKQCYLDARAEAKRGGGGRESWESSHSGGGQARGVLLTGHPKEPGIKAAKAGGLWLSMA